MLTREIAVRQKSATVRISFKCLIIKGSEQFVHIHFHTHSFCKLFKYIYPCIQVRSTVVGMSHSYQMSGRSGNHINFFIRSGKLFFQNDHGKYRSSCGNITCADCHTVCCNHSCSCITFRRTHRDSSFQFSCYIEKFCTFFCKNTGIFTCNKGFRHNITKFP